MNLENCDMYLKNVMYTVGRMSSGLEEKSVFVSKFMFQRMWSACDSWRQVQNPTVW